MERQGERERKMDTEEGEGGKQQRDRVKQGETDRRTERERINEQTTAE